MGSSTDVVIIDPNPHLLSKMSEMIRQAGFTANCFANPDTPIQYIETSFPRIALLGPSLDRDAYLKCVHKLKIMDTTLPILIASDIDKFLEISIDIPLDEIHAISSELYLKDFSQAIIRTSRSRKEKKKNCRNRQKQLFKNPIHWSHLLLHEHIINKSN